MYKKEYNLIYVTIKMNNTHYMLIIATMATFVLVSPIIQMSYAHQRALFSINGKYYLFEIGSTTEPLNVDDKNAVYFKAILPNSTDPTNDEGNGTIPVTGLENTLKAEIIAGDKNMTLNLEPTFGEEGVYHSESFYPTVQTTYDYRLFGSINGTSFDATFSCSPGGESSPPDNSTVGFSNEVTRKALLGGFVCPTERIGFPEPYISQNDLSRELNGSSTF